MLSVALALLLVLSLRVRLRELVADADAVCEPERDALFVALSVAEVLPETDNDKLRVHVMEPLDECDAVVVEVTSGVSEALGETVSLATREWEALPLTDNVVLVVATRDSDTDCDVMLDRLGVADTEALLLMLAVRVMLSVALAVGVALHDSVRESLDETVNEWLALIVSDHERVADRVKLRSSDSVAEIDTENDGEKLGERIPLRLSDAVASFDTLCDIELDSVSDASAETLRL